MMTDASIIKNTVKRVTLEAYTPLFCLCYSVLKTFIHDPLVEWEKVKGRTLPSEATNEKVGNHFYSKGRLNVFVAWIIE